MLSNYLTIAFRNLLRYKAFSLINIVGLAIGLAAVMCIYLFISFELSYDRFHQKIDSIYLVELQENKSHQISGQYYAAPAVLSQVFRNELPEVAQTARLIEESASKPVITYGEKTFNETGVFFADGQVFEILSFRFLAGSPMTALLEPQTVVLTKPVAEKYFNNANPLGKMLLMNQKPYKVTGIIEPLPANSHLQVNVLLSMESLADAGHTSWLSNAFQTYILLKEGVSREDLQAKVDALTEKYMGPEYKTVLGRSLESERVAGNYLRYTLKALKDLHLYSSHQSVHSRITYVYLFGGIALLILLIACANYINLATARATTRAKEVGVRKVLGAGKWQLVKLFLAESLGTTLIASLLALTFLQAVAWGNGGLLLDFIPYSSLSSHLFFLLLLIVGIAGGISGIVPALYISAYQPVQVLKGVLTSGQKGEKLRKIFVVMQFTISTILIISTLLIQEQVFFLQNKDLGFNKENVIVLSNVDKLGDKGKVLKELLLLESPVVGAAFTYNIVGEPYNWDAFTPVSQIEKLGRSALPIPRFVGDADFLQTMGIELKMGKNFGPYVTSKYSQIILNEEAIRRVGWQNRGAEEIIGQMINVNGLLFELAGVVKDFHYTSLKEVVGPFALVSHHPYSSFDHLLVRVKPGNIAPVLETIRQHWLSLAPNVPFQYAFLDQHLNRLYQSEQQVARVVKMFSGIAITVAFLGLLGLSLFTVERRTKEIGVRKVLGASEFNVLLLLNKEFIKLILLATLFACPIVWWGINQWLQNYAFRIDIHIGLFILPALLILLLALLTTSIQTLKAARANPIKSLRYE